MAVLPPDPVFCFKSDMGHIHSLCYSIKSDNYISHILAATEKGIVYFWDLETNRLQHKQEMGESIQAVHCYEDVILTQEKSGIIKMWSSDTGAYEITDKYECAGGFCKSIVIKDTLVVPQENGTLDVLDVRTDLKTFKMQKHLVPEKECLGIMMGIEKILLNGKFSILAGYETGDVILWNFDTGEVISSAKLQDQITSLSFDSFTCRGICAGASNILQIFNIDKQSLEIKLKGEISLINEGCNVVKFRHDGKLFVSGGWDGRIRLYSSKTFRALAVLTEHKNAITDVQFSPHIIKYWNSRIMAVSGADGTISLWNLYNDYN